MTWNSTQPLPTQLISQGQATILNNFAFLGSTTGNTNPGFYKLPNGLIVNWGTISFTTAGTKSQNYQQAYSSIVYSLQFSFGYSSAGDVRDNTIFGCVDTNAGLPLPLTQAVIRVSNAPPAGTMYIFWFAIGR